MPLISLFKMMSMCHTDNVAGNSANVNERGARKLTGENLKVVGAEFSTLS